jgi:hypothetical protein
MGRLWNSIQSWLLPALEDEIGALDEKHRLFVAVCELCDPQEHMAAYRWCGNGCPPRDRLALCKAFIAKAVWASRHRTDRRLPPSAGPARCRVGALGEVPSEATFSRAFDAFADFLTGDDSDDFWLCARDAMFLRGLGRKGLW